MQSINSMPDHTHSNQVFLGSNRIKPHAHAHKYTRTRGLQRTDCMFTAFRGWRQGTTASQKRAKAVTNMSHHTQNNTTFPTCTLQPQTPVNKCAMHTCNTTHPHAINKQHARPHAQQPSIHRLQPHQTSRPRTQTHTRPATYELHVHGISGMATGHDSQKRANSVTNMSHQTQDAHAQHAPSNHNHQ